MRFAAQSVGFAFREPPNPGTIMQHFCRRRPNRNVGRMDQVEVHKALGGKRTEFRLADALAGPAMRAVQFALVGKFRKYRPIAASTVAAAMTVAAREAKPGRHIYHYDDIVSLASRL